MTAARKSGKPESDWKKIGPCLYRYKGQACYGLVKHRGKQIRHSLETEDLALARRKLKDWRNDLELTDHTLADRTMKVNAEKFLPTIKGSAASLDNIQRHIGNLLKDWPGPLVISKIKKSDCQAWLAKYPDLRPATRNKMVRAARDFFKMAVGLPLVDAQTPSVNRILVPRMLMATLNTPEGQSLCAVLEAIAERMPNLRAS